MFLLFLVMTQDLKELDEDSLRFRVGLSCQHVMGQGGGGNFHSVDAGAARRLPARESSGANTFLIANIKQRACVFANITKKNA